MSGEKFAAGSAERQAAADLKEARQEQHYKRHVSPSSRTGSHRPVQISLLKVRVHGNKSARCTIGGQPPFSPI